MNVGAEMTVRALYKNAVEVFAAMSFGSTVAFCICLLFNLDSTLMLAAISLVCTLLVFAGMRKWPDPAGPMIGAMLGGVVGGFLVGFHSSALADDRSNEILICFTLGGLGIGAFLALGYYLIESHRETAYHERENHARAE